MARRTLLAILVMAGLLTVGTRGAAAGAQWCDEDPPVAIQTPGGAVVIVYVTNGGLGIEHLPAVQAAAIAYSAAPAAGGGGTDVRVDVTIAGDVLDARFATRSVVSTGPFATGIVYGRVEGVSGATMSLHFTLDVP